jgi:hypothetical protein
MAGHVARAILAAALVASVAACAEHAVTVPPDVAAAASAVPPDFPAGTYRLDVVEERLRMTWTLAADGTYLEIDERFDRAPQPGPVFYGTYSVDGAELTVEVANPGASPVTFAWEVDDRGNLYLRFLDGAPFDRDWFAPLADLPWVPVG